MVFYANLDLLFIYRKLYGNWIGNEKGIGIIILKEHLPEMKERYPYTIRLELPMGRDLSNYGRMIHIIIIIGQMQEPIAGNR